MIVAQEVTESVDYRRSLNVANRCEPTEFDLHVEVTTRVPGFKPCVTLWTPEDFDGLDLDAIQDALPAGSRIASRAVAERV